MATIVAGKAFHCECGCDQLEEVRGDVYEYSDIKEVTKSESGKHEVDLEEDFSTDAGVVIGMQCTNCARIIAENYDELVALAESDAACFKVQENATVSAN